MTARWSTQHEAGGLPVHRAALGDCDLSVLYIGTGWSWLVRRDGRDVAEGLAATLGEAQEQAEASADQSLCTIIAPTLSQLSPAQHRS